MQDDWRRFEEEFGPLTVQERLDALFAAVLARGSGKRVSEFMPKWGGRGSSPEAMVAGLERLARMSKAQRTKEES